MSYHSAIEKSERRLTKLATARYVGHADIANFYPSIYTHALPWAAVGIGKAKKDKSKTHWYNELDACFRRTRRDETVGVLIGPATSNIAAEIILAKIDRRLTAMGYVYQRFIDDYIVYSKSSEDFENFVHDLESQLERFNLRLNPKKTIVEKLPQPEKSEWISQLRLAYPLASATFHNISTLFNTAISIQSKYPNGSVLKYAITMIPRSRLGQRTGRYILATLLSWCLTHTHMIGMIGPYIKFGILPNGQFEFRRELGAVLIRAAELRRSDGLCWSLYYLRKLGANISVEEFIAVFKTYDCLSLILLYELGSPSMRSRITKFCRKRIIENSQLALERNWLLIHYLLLKNALKKSHVPDKTLVKLREIQFSFFDFAA